ncbi:MAG: hypothetical protein DMG64_15505 [Acidobacteria bacterium]|nr:MAG: hypothetical protein DMG64_15505 [Acidobacteriota bacterium]PYY22069.1 MAG: hypothetical protein DMG62_15175 [Acidobacteriota bacterium]
MLQLLTELLGYARKLLPLMELYAARRTARPVRDSATQEFQSYTSEALRSHQHNLMELRSALESIQQRLRVIDDQSVSLQREVARMADQHRILLIALTVSAVASVATLVMGIILVSRH